MSKYVFNQVLEVSDRERGSINRLALQASIAGSVKNRDRAIEEISKLCNNSIKEYMDNIDEWRR